MAIKTFSYFLRTGIFAILIIYGPTYVLAQKAKPGRVLSSDETKLIKKDAATLFASSEFKGALTAYQELIVTDPENAEYNYRLGVCLLHTNQEKASSLNYLLLCSKAKDPKKDLTFYLGLAYMHNNDWDMAITSFLDYKKNAGGKLIKDFPSVDRLMEMCENGKELCKRPINVSFENAGKIINTPYEEYNPYISADGKQLVFSSRRKGNVGGFIEDLGIFTSDIYGSQWKDTVWTKARSFGGLINGEWDEELVGMSPLGDMAFIYFDNVEFFGDVGYTTQRGKSWLKPVMFNEAINSKQFEGAACISLDGSTLYFSSNRKEGHGENDLWMAKKDPNGIWGSVENLGPEINSKYDEDFPWISLDGKTLYFASKGHNSMGDFDLFRSTRDEKSGKWNSPVNLGYPINTADDNHTISFTGDERFAYIASSRKDGFGNLDIWRIEYTDTLDHPFKTLITGNVISETGTRITLTKATLENITSQDILEFKPSSTGNQFVLNASPGSYKLLVEGSNFISTSVDLIIENVFPPQEISKQIVVKPSKK